MEIAPRRCQQLGPPLLVVVLVVATLSQCNTRAATKDKSELQRQTEKSYRFTCSPPPPVLFALTLQLVIANASIEPVLWPLTLALHSVRRRGPTRARASMTMGRPGLPLAPAHFHCTFASKSLRLQHARGVSSDVAPSRSQQQQQQTRIEARPQLHWRHCFLVARNLLPRPVVVVLAPLPSSSLPSLFSLATDTNSWPLELTRVAHARPQRPNHNL